MFKNKLIALSLILSFLLLTACAKTSQNTPSQTVQNENTDSQNKAGSDKQKMQPPGLYGKVISIVGNEVELQVAEMPKREANPNSKDSAKKSGSINSSMTGSSGNGPDGPGGGPRNPGSEQGATLNFTGETKKILIPVGVPITTMSQSGTKQIDIADIYEGVTLMIWYDEKDKTQITNIKMISNQSSESN